MCDCIDRFNEKLRPYNVGIESQTVIRYPEGQPEIRTERVKLVTYKVEPSRERKPGVFPTFCPLCGDPYIPQDLPTPSAESAEAAANKKDEAPPLLDRGES